jgi:transcriptional regulator GlxA family with amidase domain
MRLRTAAEMLRTSNLSIEEIISAVGYLESSRFYKNFRDVYKTTPARYRNIATGSFQ